MDQQFDNDVMDALAAESPSSDSLEMDEGIDDFEAGGLEEFENEDDEMDPYESEGEEALISEDDFGDGMEAELSEEFAEVSTRSESADALDRAVADALREESVSRFLQRLVQGLGRTPLRTQPHQKDTPLSTPTTPRRTLRKREQMGTAPQAATRIRTQIDPVVLVLKRVLSTQPMNDHPVFNQLLDWIEETNSAEMAAPIIAGLAIRSTIPQVAQFSRSNRIQLVKGISQAIRELAQRQGNYAIRAIIPILGSVQKVARHRQLPIRELTFAIRRTARQVAANADLVHRLIRPGQQSSSKQKQPVAVQHQQTSRGVQRLIVNGPVEIIIRSL